jgi:quercetin dioxygenase-like cupin family protein
MCIHCLPGSVLPNHALTPRRRIGGQSRRFALGGFAGVALALAGVARGEAQTARSTTTSPEGLIRTLLESHVDENDDEFNLVLDTFPAGIVIPRHHHPSTGLNYVLEGVAESQYEGEPMRRLAAGASFEDHAHIPHLMFRNPDLAKPVRILISYTVKRGMPFLIIP